MGQKMFSFCVCSFFTGKCVTLACCFVVLFCRLRLEILWLLIKRQITENLISIKEITGSPHLMNTTELNDKWVPMSEAAAENLNANDDVVSSFCSFLQFSQVHRVRDVKLFVSPGTDRTKPLFPIPMTVFLVWMASVRRQFYIRNKCVSFLSQDLTSQRVKLEKSSLNHNNSDLSGKPMTKRIEKWSIS